MSPSQLLKSEEDASYKPAKKACVQLVDNLVEHILKYEESLAGKLVFSFDSKFLNFNFLNHFLSHLLNCSVFYNKGDTILKTTKLSFSIWCKNIFLVSFKENKGVNSTRLVACITTLYLFSKIRAQLMVKHAMTMQPYLTTKCNVSCA